MVLVMWVGSLRCVYLYVYLCVRERHTQRSQRVFKVGQARTRLNSLQPWVSLCWSSSGICLTQITERTSARPGSGHCDPNCICFLTTSTWWKGFPSGSVVKNPPANAGASGDMGLIPGSERSLRGGNGNPLQYSCWDNPMDRGAWWSTVHGVSKSQTGLSMHAHTWWKV